MTEGFERLFGRKVERAKRGRAANAAGVNGADHRRDLIIGHLAPGEIVVPPRALSPAVMKALREALGDELPRFIVGSGFERRNPVSGLPAFSPENEEEDEGFLDRAFDFFSGLFRSKMSFPEGPRFPRDRRFEALEQSRQLMMQPDRQQRQEIERQVTPSPFPGGGGGSLTHPKLRRRGWPEEELLL